MSSEKVLDISWGTILKIALASVIFYILYLVKDIIMWFVFALIISVLFNPTVELLQKKKIPRVLAVVFVYLFFFGICTLVIYFSASFLVFEIQQFAQFLPRYVEQLSPFFLSVGLPVFTDFENLIQNFGANLGKTVSGIGTALFAIFGSIISTFFIITTAIFISLEQRPVEKTLSLFFPRRHEANILNIWARSQKKVSAWFMTRVLASLFVGILSFFAFWLLNTKYKFSLALICGLLNFIPIVGPFASGILIFLIASLDSVLKGVFVVIAFTLIQQIENNILTPILSRKFIGLSSILVLLSLAIGGELWGLLGAILAVPLAGILYEFAKEYLQKRKDQEPAEA